MVTSEESPMVPIGPSSSMGPSSSNCVIPSQNSCSVLSPQEMTQLLDIDRYLKFEIKVTFE